MTIKQLLDRLGMKEQVEEEQPKWQACLTLGVPIGTCPYCKHDLYKITHIDLKDVEEDA